MKYYWTDCPGCHCHLTINTTDYPDRISGSLRRWSADRNINDGRPIQIPRAELSSAGGFSTACVCGQAIVVPAEPDAVSAERDPDLRVTLTAD